MFRVIMHLLNSGNPLNFILNVFFLIYFIVLIILYSRFKNDNKKLKIWIITCFIPLIISIIHFIIFVSGSAFLKILPEYIYTYISSILIALSPLLVKKNIIYNVSKVVIILVCIFLSLRSINSNKVTNYTRKSLSNAYISLCDYFEKNYIMNDWKKIDYNKLKKDGLILIEEAQQTDNIDKYYEAIDNFVEAHHDGHMSLSFYNDSDYYLNKISEFNDYGLSSIRLEDGSIIAINVEDNLDIINGDRIIKWDGVDINKVIDSVKLPIGESLIENEERMKEFFGSSIGGNSVEVTYIDSDNTEKIITLKKLKSKVPRAIKSFNTFNHSNDETEYDYKMLNDEIGYLRIGVEEIDTISDSIGYFTGNHKVAREKYRKSLRELRKNGMKKLVIDIRNNKGGSDEVAMALASLFTKEKIYGYSLGYRSNNKNISLVDHYVLPDGEFSDIKVIVLTNMRCGSAGDGMVLYLSRIDGITIAGLSNPGGIDQETGGFVFMPEGVVVSYPVGLVLDENNNPNIDVDDTRESRNPVDIKIPLDKNAALRIFDGKDYELEWAIDYLNK